MKKTRCCRPLASLLIMFSLVFALPAEAALAVTQADIDSIQRQMESLTAKREQSQTRINELQAEQASVLEQKAALDERNQYTLSQIQLTAQQIKLLDTLIKEKEKEVNAAIEREAEQLEKYRSRVRAMEESSSLSILDVVTNSPSFSDMLSAVDDIGAIMESDRKLQEEYLAAREATQQLKAEYEETKAQLEAKRRELQLDQTALERDVMQACELISSLQGDIDTAFEEHEINAAAEDAVIAHLDELTRQFAQEQEDALRSALANGTFIWPVPDCTLITSRYGYRMHPILNYERFHAGIDIGAKSGDAIVASDGGTVEVAEYSDSYGNYVLINHGNGYTTVYAHMSAMAVEAGQTVAQGDTLGYVGSTGWSTGPHCHYEIRYNEEKTDPESYFTGLSYYDC